MVNCCFAQSLESVSVTAEGRGTTVAIAINDALMQCVEQVQGKRVDRVSIMADTDLKVQAGFGDNYFESPTYMDLVYSKSGGLVSGYKILSKQQLDNEDWEVKVEAQITKYVNDKSADRQRIALMPLRTEKSYFWISGRKVAAAEVVTGINQYLTSDLTQTEKFAVLDRQYLAESSIEKSLLTEDNAPIEELARLGQHLGADYILVGRIADFGYSVSEKTTRATGRKYRAGYGKAVVDYKLINSSTQQVHASDTVNANFSDQGGSAKIDAIMKLGKSLAADVSDQIQDQVFPIMLVAINQGEYVFGQGGSALKTGDNYNLYKFGNEIIDPYTNESLGRTESLVGVVEITRVTSKISYGRPVQLKEEVSENFLPKTYVLREKSPASRENTPAASTLKAKPSKPEFNDDDW
jgi:curli biogenesis system outer membrane secretion channel CsgG